MMLQSHILRSHGLYKNCSVFSPRVGKPISYGSYHQIKNLKRSQLVYSSVETPEVVEEHADVEQVAELTFVEQSNSEKAMTNFKLLFALPWRRFKNGSVLTMKLSGPIAEQPQGRFSSTTALPDICNALRKAALDPRIKGVCVKIDPLQCGWSKIQEIKRHLAYFRESGKFSIAYLERAGEKEMYLASAFEEIYAPPSASISIRGISVKGTFLRGVLDKVGVEPEVRRIGNYKSAGDQLLRHDMSEYQREQLTALLEDIYDDFVDSLAVSRGKTRQDVLDLIDEGVYDMKKLKEGNWITDLKYEDEINDILKERTDGKDDELRFVRLQRYRKVSPSAFGLHGKKTIAVVRTSGAIVGGSGSSGNVITAESIITQLRALKKNKKIAAVVLRVDSPGGDALASDLMWREIQKFSEEKPIIASMADVAASGGYYMSMGCQKIVAEPLTITGSIGVVTGKFNLSELYEKVGYNTETISRGRFAEILNESRKFSDDEAELFDKSAQYAYEQFRDKAAMSRGMAIEEMQKFAQGRVWSGQRAKQIGLVDACGGLWKAIALAKEAAEIDPAEKVTVREVSRGKVSPLSLLSSGGASLQSIFAILVFMASGDKNVISQVLGMQSALSLIRGGLGISDEDANMMLGLDKGLVMAQLPEFKLEGSVESFDGRLTNDSEMTIF